MPPSASDLIKQFWAQGITFPPAFFIGFFAGILFMLIFRVRKDVSLKVVGKGTDVARSLEIRLSEPPTRVDTIVDEAGAVKDVPADAPKVGE